MQKIQCPRCGQDWLRVAAVRATKERIVFCPECEAAWPADVDVASPSFEDLLVLLERRGIKGGSALGSLEVIGFVQTGE